MITSLILIIAIYSVIATLRVALVLFRTAIIDGEDEFNIPEIAKAGLMWPVYALKLLMLRKV